MTRILSRFAALAVALLAPCVSFAGENDVLYWMIDDTAMVNFGDSNGDQTLSSFLSSPTADSSCVARIRVGHVDGSPMANGDVFLDIYDTETGTRYSGEYGVDFINHNGYLGAGVPTGNQSPSGDYSAGTPEYCFTVEIGNVTWDENGEPTSWTTIAWSPATAYSQLGDYIHQSFDLNPEQLAVWTPAAFVPEPTSGLLTAIGFTLLALRRKRRLA